MRGSFSLPARQATLESIGDSTPYTAFERGALDQAPSGSALREKQHLGAERGNDCYCPLVSSTAQRILYVGYASLGYVDEVASGVMAPLLLLIRCSAEGTRLPSSSPVSAAASR